VDFDTDYFTLFDLPQQFAVDNAALSNTYRNLQKQYHPDRHASASDQQQRMALQYAAYINEGLEVLRSPVKRAIYLLGLADIEFKSDNLAADPQFLMQQIEWREELSELPGTAEPAVNLEKFIAEVEAELIVYEARFEEAMKVLDYDTVLPLISKMQFVSKLLNEAEQVEDQLLIS
jgi:molecular chaperone HscB